MIPRKRRKLPTPHSGLFDLPPDVVAYTLTYCDVPSLICLETTCWNGCGYAQEALSKVETVDLSDFCLYDEEAVSLLKKLRGVKELRMDWYHVEMEELRFVPETVEKLVLIVADDDFETDLTRLVVRLPQLTSLKVKLRNRVEKRVWAVPGGGGTFPVEDFRPFVKVTTSGCLVGRLPVAEAVKSVKVKAVPECPSSQLSLSDSTLQTLSLFPSLLHLRITDYTSLSSHLTDKGLSSIPRQWPHLRTLQLSSHSEEAVRNVSDLGLMRLFSLCTDLEALALDSFKMMTDAAVVEMVSSCKRLVRLSLDYTNVTGEALSMIAESGIRLKEVSLKGCRRVREEGLVEMVQSMEDLEKLNLSCTGGVTDKVVETIHDSCYYLTDLTFNEAFITPPSLSLIAELSYLRTLAINFCPDLDSFSPLSNFQYLTNLSRLSLAGYPKLTDFDLEMAVSGSIRSLLRVRVDGCSGLTDQSLSFLIENGRKLQCLYMCGSGVTKKGIERLPKAKRSLKLVRVGVARYQGVMVEDKKYEVE